MLAFISLHTIVFQDFIAFLMLHILTFSLVFRTPGCQVFLDFVYCQCLVYMFVYAILWIKINLNLGLNCLAYWNLHLTFILLDQAVENTVIILIISSVKLANVMQKKACDNNIRNIFDIVIQSPQQTGRKYFPNAQQCFSNYVRQKDWILLLNCFSIFVSSDVKRY